MEGGIGEDVLKALPHAVEVDHDVKQVVGLHFAERLAE